jgi:hypothetical protein
MIEFIEADYYFVVLNFNSILCIVVLKFCTQYNQCEHDGSVSI